MSKIRIRSGSLEVEYEGTDQFISEQLTTLVGKFLDATKLAPKSSFAEERKDQVQSPAHLPGMSINSTVARLKVKSGRDMLIAAAAHLCLVQGKEQFSKEELFELAKASTAYSKSWTPALTTNLKRLVAARNFTENASNMFSLPEGQRAELLQKIEHD